MVVDRLGAAERAGMLAHDRAVLAHDDAIGIGLDLDRAANGRREDRVFVGECQEFRVWAAMMDPMEVTNGTTQIPSHS